MRRAVTTLIITGLALSPAFAQNTQNKNAKPEKPPKAEKAAPKSKVDEPFKGKNSHVGFDSKSLTWKIGNDAVERTIHFDREAGGLMTTHVRVPGGKAMASPASEAEIQVTGADGKARTVSLGKDWVYQWQSNGVSSSGGKKLTVHMWGVRSNEGFEAESNYEVYPGNRPYLEKTVTLINRTSGPVTVTAARLDEWMLGVEEGKAAKGAKTASPKSVAVSSDMKAVAMVASDGQITHGNGGIVQRFKGSLTADGDGGRIYLPRTTFFTFRGSDATEAEMEKRYREMNPAVASK